MKLNSKLSFNRIISTISLSFAFLAPSAFGVPGSLERDDTRILVATVTHPKVQLSSGKRIMGGREAFPVVGDKDGETVLNWGGKPGFSGDALLRITAALDRRVAHRVDVKLARSKAYLGGMDVLFAAPGQVFELRIESAKVAKVLEEGIILSLAEGNDPL